MVTNPHLGDRGEDRFHLVIRVMKLKIITHNLRGLNDPDSITKERCFLTSLAPRVDVIMIQEHKLRGKAMEELGSRLMPGYAC